MDKFEMPEVQVIELAQADFITTSCATELPAG